MFRVVIHRDGKVSFVGDLDDPLKKISILVSKKRVSHIVPTSFLKRLLFKLIRICVTDDCRITNWTRTWKGPWKVTIISSGDTYVSENRLNCIRWEQKKLNDQGW